MFANRFIKTLVQNPEKFLTFRRRDDFTGSPGDVSKMQIEPARQHTVDYFHHLLTGDGSYIDDMRTPEERLPEPLRVCQFFDFGYISNDTLKEECLTVAEAFYEGFAQLPAITCFMEHQWTAIEPTTKDKTEIRCGYLYLASDDSEGDWILCSEIVNYPDRPDYFFWDGITLALDPQNQKSDGGYVCKTINNVCDAQIFGSNLFDPLLTMLGRLNAHGMDREYHPSPPKLDARRRKRGLPAMVGHTTVKIAPYRAAMGHSGARDGDEYTPKRYHFRRGHVRHFQNGEKTWVRPTFVGTPEDGSVEHKYIISS